MTLVRWRLLLWGAMLLLVGWLAWQARGALYPFIFGAILAYVFTPIVDLLAKAIPARSHRGDVLRRGAVVLLVYLVVAAIIGGLSIFLVPVAADQVAQFIDQMPQFIEDARAEGEQWLDRYRESVPQDVQDRLDPLVEDWIDAALSAAGGWLRASLSVATETLTVLIGLVVLPIWLFYALRDRHTFGRNFMNTVPDAPRRDVANLLSISDLLLSRYIRGQLVLGVVVGVAVGVGLTLMGVQLSLALGTWAGITELIPILGPWLGAIPGLIIVLATDPGLFIPVALLYLGVQQVENNLLVPRIQGQAVDLHPAVVILLLAIAGSVFGFIGLLVIVPMTSIVRELFWYADRRLRGLEPQEALDESHVYQISKPKQRAAKARFAEGEPAEAEPAEREPQPEGAPEAETTPDGAAHEPAEGDPERVRR